MHAISSHNSMGMNKKKIIIFGAFDRYNYGDLLLPLILTHYVDVKRHPQLCYASLKMRIFLIWVGLNVNHFNILK